MTNEQWIVYLYTIWPDGGFSLLFLLGFLFSLAITGVVSGYSADYDSKDPNSSWYKEKAPIKVHKKKLIAFPAIFALLLALSNFVPDKKGFLLLVSTPYLVEGTKSIIGSDKVTKFSEIIDLSLDKAINELKPQEKVK